MTNEQLYDAQVQYLQGMQKHEPTQLKAYCVECNTCKQKQWLTGTVPALALLSKHKGHSTWVRTSKKDKSKLQRDEIYTEELKPLEAIKVPFFDTKSEMLRLYEEYNFLSLEQIEDFAYGSGALKAVNDHIQEFLERWFVLDGMVLYRTPAHVFAVRVLSAEDARELLEEAEMDHLKTYPNVVLYSIFALGQKRQDFFVVRGEETRIGKMLLEKKYHLRCKELL